MLFKILGTDDSVNTCDCCGKSNLKSTVIVDVDGEILHYGSTCATRHTGLNDREIKTAIKTHSDGIVAQAKKEFETSVEYFDEQNTLRTAHKNNIKPGKAFMEYCRPASLNASERKAKIAAKFGIKSYKF